MNTNIKPTSASERDEQPEQVQKTASPPSSAPSNTVRWIPVLAAASLGWAGAFLFLTINDQRAQPDFPEKSSSTPSAAIQASSIPQPSGQAPPSEPEKTSKSSRESESVQSVNTEANTGPESIPQNRPEKIEEDEFAALMRSLGAPQTPSSASEHDNTRELFKKNIETLRILRK